VTRPPGPPDARDDQRVPDDEVEYDRRSADRLIFFSDAVAAIAITLLALDLPVPEGGTVHEFWTSFQNNDGHYAAFLISFAVIAAAWSGHHDVFRYVKRTDSTLRQLDTVWLLTIILNPFATKLLIVSGQTLDTSALRFGFYALLQVLEAFMIYAMLRHMTSRHLADTPPQLAKKMARDTYPLMLGFGLSIPLFFVTGYAWLLWIIMPILAGQLQRRRRRDGRASEGAAAPDPPPPG
jgi:uncharacterized membrane protein